MVDNPQDAKPLPRRPSLDAFRRIARALVVASQLEEKITLPEAQRQVSLTYGFGTWRVFAKHMKGLANKKSAISRFESAADAIVTGNMATLKRLLRADPKLVFAKSTRDHGATLLIYTAANGVEGYRQKSPKNIVKITKLLLDAGADFDGTAAVYGNDCTTLGLAATSVWPERAGVQEPLMQLLLDHGAQLDRNGLAGRAHGIVHACLANGRPKAAAFLAARGARVGYSDAAALGRIDVVKTVDASKEELIEALLNACIYGQGEVVEFLLKQGADLTAHMGDGQTALHMAVIGGHLNIVKLLLPYNPPLENRNQYGGTVWGQTLWSAAHGGDPDDYIAILENLLAAGARVREFHVPVNKRVDAWLAAHGSQAEPSWHWYGEKPRKEKPGRKKR